MLNPNQMRTAIKTAPPPIHAQYLRGTRYFFFSILIELLVLLLGDVGGFARPKRIDVVDDVVLVGIDVLAVLPLLDLAESDGHGQEPAVFAQQLLDLRTFGVLQRILRKMQDDRRAAVMLRIGLLHFEFGRAGAAPMHGLGLFLIGFGKDLDLVGHHERRVEAQSEMTDDRLVLVLLHKLDRKSVV